MMILDRDGRLDRVMLLRRQNEMRSISQMKGVAFARKADIS